jgi:hypothetical protein
MDPKERNIILRIVQNLRDSNFDERDVLLFLILVREHCNPQSPLRELAHFAAHRRRNRGAFHEFIIREIARINSSATRESSTPGLQFVQNALAQSPVYATSRLRSALSDLWRDQQLGEFDSDTFDVLIFCIVSLLQDCRFIDNTGNDVGRLLLAFNSYRIALLAQIIALTGEHVVFSVISIDNKFIPFSHLDDRHAASLPNNFIRVAISEGRVIVESE